jgi:hypothetical protein
MTQQLQIFDRPSGKLYGEIPVADKERDETLSVLPLIQSVARLAIEGADPQTDATQVFVSLITYEPQATKSPSA